MNTARHYIAVTANPANRIVIDAIGTSETEAIAAAVKAVGGEVTTDDFVAEKCTARLFDFVEKSGTPDRWLTRNGLEDVEVDNEPLLSDLIDHVFDGMKVNAESNTDSGLMSGQEGWSDAGDAIDCYITTEGLDRIEDEDDVMYDYVALLRDDPYAREIAEEELTGMMRRYDLDTLKREIEMAHDAEDAAEAIEKANAYAKEIGIEISEIYAAADVPVFDDEEDHDDPMGLDDKFQNGGRDDENTDWL